MVTNVQETLIQTRGAIHVGLPIPSPELPTGVPVAVWLGDRFVGNAPIYIKNVRAGAHEIVLKMAGFKSPVINVDVRDGEISQVIHIQMIPSHRVEPTVPEPEEPLLAPDIPLIEPDILIPVHGSIHVGLPIPSPELPTGVPVAVWLDDRFVGNAPIVIKNVRAGAHEIVLKMAGFKSPVINVDVLDGKRSLVFRAQMIPLYREPEEPIITPEYGSIQVDRQITLRPGHRVWVHLDNKYIGRAPLVIPNVGVGTHKLIMRNLEPAIRIPGPFGRPAVRFTVRKSVDVRKGEISRIGEEIMYDTGTIEVHRPTSSTTGLPITTYIRVELDWKFMGEAPITLNDVPVGWHDVAIRAAGFRGSIPRFYMHPGESMEIRRELIPM